MRSIPPNVSASTDEERLACPRWPYADETAPPPPAADSDAPPLDSRDETTARYCEAHGEPRQIVALGTAVAGAAGAFSGGIEHRPMWCTRAMLDPAEVEPATSAIGDDTR